LIVFTSDHGENLGSHGLVQKGTENDESIRIPLVMAGPKVAQTRVTESVASLVDLAPTFLAVAGADIPDHMHGVSLMDEAGGMDSAARDAFFQTTQGVGLRSCDMIVYARLDDRQIANAPCTVFDMQTDPFQYKNLAGTDAGSALFQRLKKLDQAFPWSELEDDPL